MAKLNTTTVNGGISATQAAANPTDLTRLQEMTAALAGKAALSHTHESGDVTDFAAAVLESIGNWLATLGGDLDWQGISGVLVQLSTSGGLMRAPDGLAVDPGRVSMPGHTHVSADVVDLSTALGNLLMIELADSDTLQWLPASGIMGEVRVQSDGGLVVSAAGLAVDFGTGSTQAATGDHTHAQLHNPLTLGPSSSLQLALVDQQLSGEVLIEANGGLLLTTSGLAVDFGTSATQAAPGNHTHTVASLDFGTGVSDWAATWLASSSTIGWTNADGTLTPSVRLDPSTGPGQAPLGVSSSGLYAVLGTSAWQCAAGDHGHSVATESTPGFMAAADKAALDMLVGTPELLFQPPLQLASGVVSLWPATHAQPGSMSAADKIKLDELTTLAFLPPLNQDADGNVSMPPATDTQDGYMTAALVATLEQQGTALAALQDGSTPQVTQAQWGFMAPTDKAKLDAMCVISNVAPPLTLDSNNLLGLDTSGLGLVTSVNAPLTVTSGALGLSLDSGCPLALSDGALTLPLATGTAAGAMSASDKAKLDAISAFSGGVVDSTLELAAGLDPAIQLDSAAGPAWGIRVNGTTGQLEWLYNGSVMVSVDGGSEALTAQGGFVTGNGAALTVQGQQVVGAQQAAITNAADLGSYTPTASGYGFASSADMTNFLGQVHGAIAQLNLLLAALRAGTGHGLIASS
ncbi:MAG TPA: hypothetical protein VMU04_24660 [Candidatus Acidoferrum sp.]|nr:hypothetical protein [Candidatus Acidoferrum sp.]